MANLTDLSESEYLFTIKNSRDKIISLGIEPWGFYWPMEPGDEFEIVFDDAKNFWTIGNLDVGEDHITYWEIYPSMVYFLASDGTKEEMMNG